MTIDWSKAPADATHYDPVDQNFLREVGPALLMYRINVGWVVPHHCQYAHTVEDTVRPLMIRPAWNGEGLPPSGERVERSFSHSTWKLTTICGHSTDGGYAAFYDGDGLMGWADKCKLRPIRTAEQIAEDERLAGIAEIQRIVEAGFASGSSSSASLWDAGYRKQVSQ
ncbi:hypothetical protein [Pseudomonas sp. RGM 3321]|uniref:hypothetical protein n=1 Tax=Pseudomonas sp. RGM 3321 TaxID=2930089 RepID=UPI001FCB8918|nr:hypothetical protein [Pseudomonas sp. RGM 3321]MCJ2375142.1 hypothetical protein [Pseudomonas sp. RGM 3321]